MLEVSALRAGYGDALAISDISFMLDAGGALALLGRNGAGKTTTLSSVMGLVRPWSGRIVLEGRDITGASPDTVARAGIGFVPEDRRIFTGLSVRENLETGRKAGPDGSAWTPAQVFDLFPEIARRDTAMAGTLSGGERQMLAISRALMGNPRLLILDEPSEGLAPVVIQRLGEALEALRQDGMAMLISEQNQYLAAKVSDQVAILETGEIGFAGTFTALRDDPGIARRLLGV